MSLFRVGGVEQAVAGGQRRSEMWLVARSRVTVRLLVLAKLNVFTCAPFEPQRLVWPNALHATGSASGEDRLAMRGAEKRAVQRMRAER